jgi:hypothetical protein
LWSNLKCLLSRRSWRMMSWRLVLILRRLEILKCALEVCMKMDRELTRFYPVVLEFWKRVLLPSDELVDLLFVKSSPEFLFFLRKIVEVELFTAQKL